MCGSNISVIKSQVFVLGSINKLSLLLHCTFCRIFSFLCVWFWLLLKALNLQKANVHKLKTRNRFIFIELIIVMQKQVRLNVLLRQTLVKRIELHLKSD